MAIVGWASGQAAALLSGVVIPAVLSVTGALTSAATGSSAAFSPTIAGGFAPYTMTVSAGTLPPGRSLSGLSVTGTYTTAGSYSYTLKVTDSVGASATLSLSVTVSSAATLAKLAAGVARVVAGTGPASINFYGDSLTSGYVAGQGGGGGAVGYPSRPNSTPSQIAAALKAAGVAGGKVRWDSVFGTGILISQTIATYNASVNAAVFQIGSDWTLINSQAFGAVQLRCATGVQPCILTPMENADSVTIAVQNGSYIVEDDNGQLTNSPYTVPSSGYRVQTFKRSVPSKLPIRIRRDIAGTATDFILLSVVPSDSTNPMLHIHNMGWPGSASGTGASSSTTYWRSSSSWQAFGTLGTIAPAPDAVFIELGANDQGLGLTDSEYQTNMDAIVARVLTNGAPDVVLVKTNPSINGDARNISAGKLAALDAVASARTLPPVLNYNSISYAASDMGDDIHPNLAGTTKKAQAGTAYIRAGLGA